MDFRQESLAGLAEQVATGKVSSRELVQHALDRIDALNPQLNAFVAVDGERALETARAIDDRIARGEQVGDLAGIPIGVKDLEDAAGFVTSKGTASAASGPGATADSALVARLKDAGCIVLGKTNTPELGWTAQTYNTTFGTTRNPWNADHTPGGSSGGSAAALASGMVPLATGSDGGGSIRIPSALCGLSGFKPSLGRVPSGGSEPPDWQHLSTKGPMARTVADIALALDEVIGPDPTDLRSLPMPEVSWQGAIAEPHVPMKVAWSPTLGYAEPDAEVRRLCESAVRTLESLGAEIVEVDTVFEEDPLLPWLTLASTYNLRTLEDVRGTELWDQVDPTLAMLVEHAAGHTGLELVKAEDMCHRLNIRLVELFHDVRLLVCPVTACAAPKVGEPGMVNGAPDVNWVRYTYGFNMTRSPAGTVNVGLTGDGLPVGLQLIGPQHGDLVVLRTMAALETALGLDALAPIG
jgi:aspartyl-tRNA(Asn)/glutamyl-tRNA(Gln) amidotransferase subunit A